MRWADWFMFGMVVATLGVIIPALVEARRRSKRKEKHQESLTSRRELDLTRAQAQILKSTEVHGFEAGEAGKLPEGQMLDINRSLPLQIVVGTLPRSSEEPLRNSIAEEDFYAASTLSAIAAQNGLLPAVVTTAAELEKGCRDNLFLVGSPNRNSVTGQVLSEMEPTLDCRFLRVEESEREVGILFHGRLYTSPLYDQEQQIRKDPRGYEGKISDYGLLAFTPSPWNSDARVLIVAGIRALGTKGAAMYLKDHPEVLGKDMSRPFALVIRVWKDDITKEHVSTDVVGDHTLGAA